MKLFMKYLFWGPQNIFSLEKPTSTIYFQALHHLEDSEPVKVVKRFFPCYPNLRLYHGLLRNKHNENIHEIPFLGSAKYIFA